MAEKEKKDSGPSTDSTIASLIPKGTVPARELTPSETNPALFAGETSPEGKDSEAPRTFHRHPLSYDLDVTDWELARHGLILPAEAPPKDHGYIIDSDEEDVQSGSQNVLKKRGGSNSHSALNQKWRKASKFGNFDIPPTPLDTVAEDEAADKSDSLVSNKPLSEKAKGKKKAPYPDDLDTSFFTKFIVAEPRLAPLEYSRIYYVEKAKCDAEGIPCPLPPPEVYWAWTENYDRFLCIPKVPDTINRTPLVTKLNDSGSGSNGGKYIHTEIPTLRRKGSRTDLRKMADFGLARLAKLATASTGKLLKRTKSQPEEEKPLMRMTPVLPNIDVGGTRLSIGTFAIGG